MFWVPLVVKSWPPKISASCIGWFIFFLQIAKILPIAVLLTVPDSTNTSILFTFGVFSKIYEKLDVLKFPYPNPSEIKFCENW